MADWQIAEAAEANMKPISQLTEELGILPEEVIPMGRQLAKIDYNKVLDRLESKPTAKYIDVTAITPTPLGEGKSTTVVGLIDGLGRLGKKVTGALRQPSSGPTFNIKGSAAGGGLAQCIPLAPFSIRFTGDIDSITNAHNLCMVALTARMQHERNYDDERLEKSKLKRLDIDPDRIHMKWVIDFCAQSLRNITIGQGGKMDGYHMDTGFAITVSSELMAILSVARDLKDLRERIGKMVVAHSRSGNEITTADLEVDGAMTAWMLDTINPSLVQTIEGNPVLIHAGPFANIAIGQSSIIADRLATKLGDYHKCRMSGIRPDAVVIVATIRALKMHGGGPTVKPGKPLDEAYTHENIALVENGCDNLIAHIETVKKAGVTPVVCVNGFYTDTQAEIDLVKKVAQENGAMAAYSQHWLKGGEGAIELAETVVKACEEPEDFHFLYDLNDSLKTKVEKIATNVYGASGIDFSTEAQKRLSELEQDPDLKEFGVCMVKTHLSLSHDPDMKNRPKNFRLPIRGFLVFKGAGFIVPLAGDIKLMPGTASNPAYRRIDVDVKTGKVQGLF
jgi:formate--tetrahydrofolate ligase